MSPRAWTASVLAFGLIATGGAALARFHETWSGPAPRVRLAPQVIEVERGLAQPRLERSFIGVVLASDSVEVAARTGGQVQEIRVRLGSRVALGDRIALLDTRGLRRELAVAVSQVAGLALEVEKKSVELQEAKQRLERRKAGAQLEVATVSGEELTTAEFRGQQAALDLRVAGAKVAEQQARVELLRQQLDDSELRAPFAGVVAARYVDPGAVVSAGSSVVRLLGSDQIRLRFGVPEPFAGRFAVGGRAEVQIEGAPGVFAALIERSAPEVDTAARVVFIEARLLDPPNSSKLALAGRIARVRSLDGDPTGSRAHDAARRPGSERDPVTGARIAQMP